MASVLSRLSPSLAIAAVVACGSEEPSDMTKMPTGGSASSGAAGTATGGSATGGTSSGGSSTGGSATGGGASTMAGSGGTSAGQDAGGSSSGGTDTGGDSPGGSGAAGGGGSGGSGMGGSQGATDSGDSYASDVMIKVHSEVHTILNVTWNQTKAADTVFLEYTFESGNVMTSRPKPGAAGMHTDVVLGAPGSTPVTVRVVSRVASVDHKTRDYMGTTGAVPAGMPVPQVMMYNAAIASPDRWLFGAVENSTGGCNTSRCYYHTVFWVYIMDRKGRIVWYYSDPSTNATPSFQRVARDGEYIWIEKRPFSNSSTVTRGVIKRTLDGTYNETIPVDGLADCIDVTTDGSLLYDASSTLRERTREGMTRNIFSCRTHFGTGFACYTNTINWNEKDDTVMMSYPEERTVIQVKRSDGEVVGQYGAAEGSYAFAPTPAPPEGGSWEFGYQHFPNITKDGTLILSTHMPGYRDTDSPVAGQHAFEEYDIDRTNQRLTMRWFFQIPGQEWAMYKGMAIKLPNGNVLGNVGTGGVIREITPDKQTAFMVKFDAPATTAQNNDFFNKMVGNNVLIDDLYALNGGGPR